MPDESTLRKLYVPKIYNELICKIQQELCEEDIYLIIDESTDVEQRYILNILIGKLNGKRSKPYLVYSKELHEVNNITVCQAINDCCRIVYPSEIKYNRLKLVVSDQAAYMVKAVRNLKGIYPNVNHVTCLAHALHRVCEKIRKDHEKTNSLISAIQSILCKSPFRRQMYVRVTGLPLPPKVVITRWGTWLNFCFYLKKNWQRIEQFITEIDFKSKSVAAAKQLFKDEMIQSELLEIGEYSCLVEGIVKLQRSDLTMEYQISIIEDIKAKLSGSVLEKLESSLSKNPDILKVSAKTNTFDHRSQFRYAPMVSVDVERSFSKHKLILHDSRRSFTLDNLEMAIVIQYNYFVE